MKYQRINPGILLVFSFCLTILVGCSQDNGSESVEESSKESMKEARDMLKIGQ